MSQRVREIGVRMALGATRGRILAWILSYDMSWAAAGLVFGALAAVAALAALAAYIPARRAATLDPAITLRQE